MNIQKSAIELFSNACYAYCLAYIGHQTEDFKLLTSQVVDWYVKGYIDDDGYVSKPLQCLQLSDVKKVKIDSLKQLPAKGIYAVEFVYGVKHHFVVCKYNKVVFDPWENSETVKYGKPLSYRLFN